MAGFGLQEVLELVYAANAMVYMLTEKAIGKLRVNHLDTSMHSGFPGDIKV